MCGKHITENTVAFTYKVVNYHPQTVLKLVVEAISLHLIQLRSLPNDLTVTVIVFNDPAHTTVRGGLKLLMY